MIINQCRAIGLCIAILFLAGCDTCLEAQCSGGRQCCGISSSVDINGKPIVENHICAASFTACKKFAEDIGTPIWPAKPYSKGQCNAKEKKIGFYEVCDTESSAPSYASIEVESYGSEHLATLSNRELMIAAMTTDLDSPPPAAFSATEGQMERGLADSGVSLDAKELINVEETFEPLSCKAFCSILEETPSGAQCAQITVPNSVSLALLRAMLGAERDISLGRTVIPIEEIYERFNVSDNLISCDREDMKIAGRDLTNEGEECIPSFSSLIDGEKSKAGLRTPKKVSSTLVSENNSIFSNSGERFEILFEDKEAQEALSGIVLDAAEYRKNFYLRIDNSTSGNYCAKLTSPALKEVANELKILNANTDVSVDHINSIFNMIGESDEVDEDIPDGQAWINDLFLIQDSSLLKNNDWEHATKAINYASCGDMLTNLSNQKGTDFSPNIYYPEANITNLIFDSKMKQRERDAGVILKCLASKDYLDEKINKAIDQNLSSLEFLIEE